MSARTLSVLATGLMLAGCVSWQPGWQDAVPIDRRDGATGTFAEARALADGADTEAKLLAAIEAYRVGLDLDPEHYETLTELCQLTVLRAAAYTTTVADKKPLYKRGIRYCERALYTNGEFRRLVDGGASIDEAAPALTLREAEAMLFWVTGVSYYFKECVRGLGKLTGFRLIARTETILERLAELNPDYGYGAVHFSRGIYYLGLPKFAGGDDRKSLELLNRAEEVGPESLLVRWGRAKYYHYETRNRAGFERDLEWVLAQDPHARANPYAWNVYFQRDAAELLARADRLF